MRVSLGTLAQETAVTILAPCLAIPPASASLPTINPTVIKFADYYSGYKMSDSVVTIVTSFTSTVVPRYNTLGYIALLHNRYSYKNPIKIVRIYIIIPMTQVIFIPL